MVKITRPDVQHDEMKLRVLDLFEFGVLSTIIAPRVREFWPLLQLETDQSLASDLYSTTIHHAAYAGTHPNGILRDNTFKRREALVFDALSTGFIFPIGSQHP
jgi:hypothetical protein